MSRAITSPPLFAMLEIDVLSLFPEIITGPLSQSIMGRAMQEGILSVRSHQLRDWSEDKHHRTDDYLCGGGQGMLLKCEPLFAAIRALLERAKQQGHAHSQVILMTPQGRSLNQSIVEELAAPCIAGETTHYIILCGHYEGVDQRVIDSYVDHEISLGDYILTNGAIAAVVLIDAIARLLPGALGDARSSVDESFSNGLLEAPAYTRPIKYETLGVPPVLLSGNHKAIDQWKQEQSLERTRKNRPDLHEIWVAEHPEYFSAKATAKRAKLRQSSYPEPKA